jgi:hypothetical protein
MLLLLVGKRSEKSASARWYMREGAESWRFGQKNRPLAQG